MKRHALYLGMLPFLGATSLVHAQSAGGASDTTYTQSDFGGVGLMQTPTARMNQAGELSFVANRTMPYTRYAFSGQPLDWLEVSFRYTSIYGVPYGAAATDPHLDYKDKSIDARVRLWRESAWRPAVTVGARDVGGTGLFSAEYLVASKRLYDFDVSLGLGCGYLGSRAQFSNPFAVLDDRFRHRPADYSSSTGSFTADYFRGPVALFGGISYRVPHLPLQLKVEYEGNDYRNEPHDVRIRQSSPVNLGAVWRVNKALDLNLGWERGNQWMFGITLHTNLAQDRGPDKVQDAPPEPLNKAMSASATRTAGTTMPDTATSAPTRAVAARTQAAPRTQPDWADISTRLDDNAGITVQSVARRGRELIVTGEQNLFFYPAEGIGRAMRILDNSAGTDWDWFTFVSTREGLPVAQTSVHRQRFEDLLEHKIELNDFRRSTEVEAPQTDDAVTLYRPHQARFSGAPSLGYQMTLGSPDGFILYQVDADYDAEYRLSRHTWLSGHVSANLFDNYANFTYDAPSKLPRVRTDVRRYVTSSRLHLTNLQYNAAWRLGQDTYGRVYAGILESMYGGGGAEWLYRPMQSRWALGADVNWVRQRGFEQHLGWRSYHTTTGHVTAYVDTGVHDILATLSVGRYLAGDVGATLNLSRVFANGVRMGAYATITSASGSKYGEGSFDKGLYVSIPFDLFLPRSSTGQSNFVWQPLLRDGGAFLGHRYSLYTLTGDRDPRLYEDNLDMIGQ